MRKIISLQRMLDIERWVDYFMTIMPLDTMSDEDILAKLKLKIKYVEKKELSRTIDAELGPYNGDEYFGLIKIKEGLKNQRLALLHEVMHYVIDVGMNKRVEETFSCDTDGNTKNIHEQEITYTATAIILRRQYMYKFITDYDNAKDSQDELNIIHEISQKSGLDRDEVLHRWREVRQLMCVDSVPFE